MHFCMNDPLVKWLSDAFPIIMSNDCDFVDPHNEETIDANGICFRTITDVKTEQWSVEDRNNIRKYSIFDDFEDHIDFETLSGNMNNELDIDFRFDGPTNAFETGNTVGTGLGTAYIFEVHIKKALLRSKRDNVGNELKEGAVEYIADAISEYMYENNFKELLDEMSTSIIDKQDKDVFNWD
eukprot:scaffold23014_cov66-Attheya_sp.AAC.2